MDTVYDMRSGIWAMLSEAFMYRINQIRIKKKSQKQSVLVMYEEDVKEYWICEKNAQIEIRDAFNSHLVIQRYDGKEKRIIVFIPSDWKEKIGIKINKGTVRCFQKQPFEGLEVIVKKGKIAEDEKD